MKNISTVKVCTFEIQITHGISLLTNKRSFSILHLTGKQFLSNLSWTALRVEGHIIDGDQCASLFEYERPDASIKGFDYFLLENGKIKEIRPYLNPIEGSRDPGN